MSGISEWLHRVAEAGGKGVVNNIDAGALGRAADEIDALEAELAERPGVARAKRTLWKRIWDPLNVAAFGPLDVKAARIVREKQEIEVAKVARLGRYPMSAKDVTRRERER